MIITNGTIIDPVENTEYIGDIYINDGKIVDIVKKDNEPPGISSKYTDFAGSSSDQIIDATGLKIAPGLIDTHVHFRDPGFTHKEDIFTGAKAAAAGGFTQVILMANTSPRIDNPESLSYVLEKGKQTDIKVHTCANVSMDMAGKMLVDLDTLSKNGAVGFTDDGIPLTDGIFAKAAMKACAKLDLPISFHEEDPTLIDNNGINRGKASEHFGIGGSPREAEISLISRDIEIAKNLKSEGVLPSVVIQHISTKEGVELVREAKACGLNIHVEATPHHFSLTEEAAIKHGTMAKMNPPLRTEDDRLAIIEGLKDGTIDLIATDHAPHSAEEKAKPLTEAPSGITGLETSLSLAITNLVNPGLLTYPELLKCMSLNPARLYKLEGGCIKVGAPADLVIFDDKTPHTYTSFASKSDNTPFKGETLMGEIKYTVCNGKVIYSA